MGQCVGCIKYLLFIFNFALWLLGCTLLSVGIWMKMDDGADHYVQRMAEKVDDEYQISYSSTGDENMTETLAYLLIVFGIILIVVTFIGCCGAVRENTCLLITFSICLFVLMIALIGVGSWAHVKKNNVEAHTDDLRNRTDMNIERGVTMYYTDEVSELFMDGIQKRFRCCGGKNAQNDYIPNPVPDSCEEIGRNRRCNYYYFRYVGDEIQEFLEERFTVIAGVSFGVAVCLGIGMVFTLLLYCFIKRSTRLIVS